MQKFILFVFCVLTFNASANELFVKSDVAAGKALHNKNCISCHASSYGGNGSAIYTRDFAKVTDAKKLITQVRNCNTNLGLKWFEEDELNTAAYLNQIYYQFDR
jgi:mono/diheme cytochrome c family protein